MKADVERLTALSLAIFRANGELIDAGDRLTEDVGLSSARWQILGAIALAGQPLPVAQIARNMGLSRQGAQRLVDELHRTGFVALQDNPNHKRAYLVCLTKRGEDTYAAIMKRWNTLASRLAAALNSQALKTSILCLEQLSEALGKQGRRS